MLGQGDHRFFFLTSDLMFPSRGSGLQTALPPPFPSTEKKGVTEGGAHGCTALEKREPEKCLQLLDL
jgi:hypothetical protein